MGRFSLSSGGRVVSVCVTLFLLLVLSGGTAHAAPFDWWEWTGEAGDNDLGNVNDWRWSNGSDWGTSSYGSGNWGVDPNGTGFGHPLAISSVLGQRAYIDGSDAPGGSKTVNVPAGESFTFSYYSTLAIGGGVTVNVSGGTLAGTQTVYDNGCWNDALEQNNRKAFGASDVNDGTTVNGSGQTSQTFGYSYNYMYSNTPFNGNPLLPPALLPATIHVSNGGSFSASAFQNNIPNFSGSNTSIQLASGQQQANSDLGVFADGYATVSISGTYNAGYDTANGFTSGGGFLTVKGYDSRSSINIGTLELLPSPPNTSYGALPGTLSVVLDGSNAGGNFDTVQAGTLEVANLGTTVAGGAGVSTVPVAFNLSLAGYAPHAGDWFQIISATTLENGASSGTLGGINVNGTSTSWNTPFSLNGATFQFEQSYNNSGLQPGVWLEVVSTPIYGVWSGGGGNSSWSTSGNWRRGGRARHDDAGRRHGRLPGRRHGRFRHPGRGHSAAHDDYAERRRRQPGGLLDRQG